MPGLFPTFFLHMERGDGRKVFLLASRRRVKSTGCSVSREGLSAQLSPLSPQYLISADPANMSTTGPAFRGLLNSNLLGTQFR